MKVLIADKLPESSLLALREAGHTVVVEPKADGDVLREALRAEQPQILIVRSTKVPAEVLEAAPRLSLIVRAGAGYDNIDVKTASARGVFVANCPGRNALAACTSTPGKSFAQWSDSALTTRSKHSGAKGNRSSSATRRRPSARRAMASARSHCTRGMSCGSARPSLSTTQEPTFEADTIAVKPGHLIKAAVEGISPMEHAFQVSDGKIVQPFGGPVRGVPVGGIAIDGTQVDLLRPHLFVLFDLRAIVQRHVPAAEIDDLGTHLDMLII